MVVYADYNSTSIICDPAAESMMKAYRFAFANPSATHEPGRKAKELLENARESVSFCLGCKPENVIFTSGATESNNLAISGRICFSPPGYRIITSAIEHPSVYEVAKLYENEIIGVNHLGEINLDDLSLALQKPGISMVSLMMANNEIGTLQPVDRVAEMCSAVGVPLHVDASQYIGKYPLRIDEHDISAVTISSHKTYGPRGVGALYMRDDFKIETTCSGYVGGKHERSLRPGTENVPAIAGFAAALLWVLQEPRLSENAKRILSYRDTLERELRRDIPWMKINAEGSHRLYNTSSICIPGLDAEVAATSIGSKIAITTGSACNIGNKSRVLEAIGRTPEEQKGALRISLGIGNTEEDVHTIKEVLLQEILRQNEL